MLCGTIFIQTMLKIECDIVAVTHRLFFSGSRKKGGFDKILDFFAAHGKKILFIEHPLTALQESAFSQETSVISLIDKTGTAELLSLKAPFKHVILNWIWEFWFNIHFVLKNVRGKPVLMAVDPLNGLLGVFLKFKFLKTYLHCIDYSEKRFENGILNSVYGYLLKLNLVAFDLIGVVSRCMQEPLCKIHNCAAKLFYIPNSPSFVRQSLVKKEPYSLICTGGGIIKKYNYEFILEVLKLLKKDFSAVLLYALGNLEEDPKYVAKLKDYIFKNNLAENVVFTGFLPLEKVSGFLQKATVGLSFYDKTTHYYMKYGDPIKIREYALYGIPIISDGVSAVDDEMLEKRVGFVVQGSKQTYTHIKALFEDTVLYKRYQTNCISWAKEMDKEKLLQNLQGFLFDE